MGHMGPPRPTAQNIKYNIYILCGQGPQDAKCSWQAAKLQTLWVHWALHKRGVTWTPCALPTQGLAKINWGRGARGAQKKGVTHGHVHVPPFLLGPSGTLGPNVFVYQVPAWAVHRASM